MVEEKMKQKGSPPVLQGEEMEPSDSLEREAGAPLLHEISSSGHYEDISVVAHGGSQLQLKLGDRRAHWIVYGFQFLHKVAFSSISTNLIVYLTTVLHGSNASSAAQAITWSGTCYFTPLIGALVADTFWGYYKTIFVSSLIYLLGLIIITASAVSLSLYPPCEGSSCHPASDYQRIAFFSGLYLIAFGSGGIDSGMIPLGADQFDENKKTSFFVWMYLFMTLGFLTSGTVVVWIQEYVGWSLGFGIATSCLTLGFGGFICGRPMYQLRVPSGSPLKNIMQVVVASFKKSSSKAPTDSSLLYEVEDKQSNNLRQRRLAHTDQFRFLDKAAVVSSSDLKYGDPRMSWRLCTVTQVEELKIILRLLPLWMTCVVFVIANSQTPTMFVEQGSAMETQIWSVSIPPASLSAFKVISAMAWAQVYKKVVVSPTKCFRNESGLSLLQRMGVGHVLIILTMATAAFLEVKRLESMKRSGIPISIAWQLPQYFIAAGAEVFLVISKSELFYEQAPESMKSISMAVTLLSASFGSYLSSLIVSLVGILTTAGGKTGWIPDDLNEGHLDYFFWCLAALCTLNFVAHIAFAKIYRSKTFLPDC